MSTSAFFTVRGKSVSLSCTTSVHLLLTVSQQPSEPQFNDLFALWSIMRLHKRSDWTACWNFFEEIVLGPLRIASNIRPLRGSVWHFADWLIYQSSSLFFIRIELIILSFRFNLGSFYGTVTKNSDILLRMFCNSFYGHSQVNLAQRLNTWSKQTATRSYIFANMQLRALETKHEIQWRK